jgi:SAM-dependent methyltransferase
MIEKITEKKPYSFLNKNFVKKLAILIKAKNEKEKLKLVRAKLRKISGFALPLKFYKKFRKLEFSEKLLEMHRSTRERKNHYPWLIEKIKNKGNTILDLGCGFNLIALYYNNFIPKKYIGYDIDCAVVEFVNRFSKEKKLNARILCQDISEIEFKNSDICLCFKLFDALEDVEWNITKTIMKKLKSKTKTIIVSFSNVTLSGRAKLRSRDWFEKILLELGLKYEIENKGNEIFYFIN